MPKIFRVLLATAALILAGAGCNLASDNLATVDVAGGNEAKVEAGAQIEVREENSADEGSEADKARDLALTAKAELAANSGGVKAEASVSPVPGAGLYEDYSPAKLTLANTGKVVLFFKASWCPSCRSLDLDILKNLNAIPKDVAILKIDYDSSDDLKKKYGVTYQHTFVQVDAQGQMITKWSGSPTLVSLLSQVK
ncbi:MAG: thioredoxin family protein [Candidatus Magasanikbacteria bacterium]|nr:thioredoxin family protein [Candidatus Magasanikbacteria bacterium]